MANSECTHMRVGKEPCVACGGKRESNTKDPSTLDKAFSTGWGLFKEKEACSECGMKTTNPDLLCDFCYEDDEKEDEKTRGANKNKSNDRAFSTGWDIVKTQINRVKSPSPDADAGSQKCRECDNQGGALPCKSCGYMKTPTGKQRQTKPSQRNNKTYQILRSDIECHNPFPHGLCRACNQMKRGYKSDRGQKPAPKLPTPKKDKNEIK